MARKVFSLRQNRNAGFLLIAQIGVIVVAEGAGGGSFRQHRVKKPVLRSSKKIVNVRRRGVGVELPLLRGLETAALEENPRHQITGRRAGILENDGLAPELFEPPDAAVPLCEN